MIGGIICLLVEVAGCETVDIGSFFLLIQVDHQSLLIYFDLLMDVFGVVDVEETGSLNSNKSGVLADKDEISSK